MISIFVFTIVLFVIFFRRCICIILIVNSSILNLHQLFSKSSLLPRVANGDVFLLKHTPSLDFKRPLCLNEQKQSKTTCVVYYRSRQRPEIYIKNEKKHTYIHEIRVYTNCSFWTKFKDRVCFNYFFL